MIDTKIEPVQQLVHVDLVIIKKKEKKKADSLVVIFGICKQMFCNFLFMLNLSRTFEIGHHLNSQKENYQKTKTNTLTTGLQGLTHS